MLAALAVVKLATPAQLRRLLPTARGDKAVRNALNDLARHRLATSDGREGAEYRKIWRLTPAGQRAALALLPAGTAPGGTGEGAARTGARHAMAVTDTIAAFVASGVGGPVQHWRTEAVHPLDGRRRVIPDAVLYAPGTAVPLLTVEVDRDTMGAQRVAAKLPAYLEYYQRRTKTPIDGTHQVWQQTYPGATSPEGSYPPLALVLADITDARARTWTDEFAALTRQHWRGTRADREGRAVSYWRTVPIVVTTLPELLADGPAAPIWHRLGHAALEPLVVALDDPDGRRLADVEARERVARLRATPPPLPDPWGST
ncbi:replication-relaxation family protein [Embleya sp. NPDC005575]|uniref:replication-relaxation family protein n=1 Tax=Embleya sp. NPDC005575 TaxID=3156892 RepID=UPI0033A6ADB7